MFFEVEDPGLVGSSSRAALNVRELVYMTKGVLAKGTVDGTFSPVSLFMYRTVSTNT